LDAAVAGGTAAVAAGQAQFELIVVYELNFLRLHNGFAFVSGAWPIFGPWAAGPLSLPVRRPQIGSLPVMRMTLRSEVGQWLSN
jgi:hypothetical protein